MDLNFNQTFNRRNRGVMTYEDSLIKIGKNILSNRFNVINNLIDHDWLNLSEAAYKIKCKTLLLK